MKMVKFVKSLGTLAPITGSNFMGTQAQTLIREKFDYVDNHTYADHHTYTPSSPFPLRFHQQSSTSHGALVPRIIMPTSVFGRPFVLTEYHSVIPNAYRSEGSVTMPAYAGLQGWDAINTFQYACEKNIGVDWRRLSNLFPNERSDWITGDRISALQFIRGDIRPAKSSACFSVDESVAFGGDSRQMVRISARLFVSWVDHAHLQYSRDKDARHPKHGICPRCGGQFWLWANQLKKYQAGPGLLQQLMSDGSLPVGSADTTGRGYKSETGHENEHRYS